MTDTTTKAMTLEQAKILLANVIRDMHESGWRADLRKIKEAIDAHLAAHRECEPYLYVYEYDSHNGVHREFSPREWNGLRPDRTVPLYTVQPIPAQRDGEAVAWVAKNRLDRIGKHTIDFFTEVVDQLPLETRLYITPPHPRVVTDAAAKVIHAWDFLEGGKHYSVYELEKWLANKLAPAIKAMRAALTTALSEKGHG